MNSKALDSFTQNQVVFEELIELVNNVSAGQKELMMRLQQTRVIVRPLACVNEITVVCAERSLTTALSS